MTTPPSRRDRRSEILASALRCIARGGIATATMGAIAAEANVSRMMLYRHFASREALLEAILTDRFRVMLEKFAEQLRKFRNLRQALVEGGIFAIGMAEKDNVVRQIMSSGTDHLFERFMLNFHSGIGELHRETWKPIIAASRRSGELHSPLSDERLIEGIRSIMASVMLRSDLTEDGRRQYFRDFLVPAIMAAGSQECLANGTATAAAQRTPRRQSDQRHNLKAQE